MQNKNCKIFVASISIILLITPVSALGLNLNQKKLEISNNTLNSDLETDDVEYYALIVGIATFAGGNIYPEEDKIDDDAINMYNLLLESKNWKEENIKLLINENATKDKIQDSIVSWLDEREDENDVVLIYYSTHGWKLKLNKRHLGNAYIFTYNQTEENRLEDKITDKEFDSYVDELESNHITIILGSCYSGRMLQLRQIGRVMLAAGGKYFFCGVDEDDTLGGGIFTYFIQQGLKGVADINNDGWVTAEEAFFYARLPTIHFSIYKQFPFVIEWMNQSIIWFFQVPRMYDRYPGSLKLYQYEKD